MDDSTDYRHGFPAIDVNKKSVLEMLAKVASFKMEERDLALDGFKKSSDSMEAIDDFWANGKNAILYLDSACKSSNYLGDLAKDVMKLVWKEDQPQEGSSQSGMNDDDKKKMAAIAESFMREKRKGEEERNKKTYEDREDDNK